MSNQAFNKGSVPKKGNKGSVEFPSLNTQTTNYNLNSSVSNTNHQGYTNIQSAIDEEMFIGSQLVRDNSAMISRIKSSTQPKSAVPSNFKRVVSAYPSDSKSSKSISNSNLNLTGLIEENQKLKAEISRFKADLSNSKKEITQLENEIDKKDKLIDEISTLNSNNLNILGTNQNVLTGINMKLIETKLINGMKKQFKDLKKDYNKKVEELEEIKRLLKTSKLNELAIENQTLIDELNKVKNFYKISVRENQNKIQLVRELEILQENFSKQQFMIISLQEKSENDVREINAMRNEVMKDKAVIADRNKKIAELKRNYKIQVEYSNRMMNFKENQEFLQIKANWEKKTAELKKDLAYFKQMSDKNGSRKKDLEDELKRLKDSIKNNANNATQNLQGSPRAVDGTVVDNPEENIDTRIQIYKNKLNELYAEVKRLEKENAELREVIKTTSNNANISKIETRSNNQTVIINKDVNEIKEFLNNTNTDLSHLNNTKLKVENTNVSSNMLQNHEEETFEISIKEIEKMKILSEDNFNEMIYILMKNFEANKIDSSVIDSAFPSFKDKSNSEIVQCLSKSILYLLKNKNTEDLRTVCQVLVTFIKKTNKDLEEFKKAFLSIFENISLFSGEQRTHYNKHLKRKFKNNVDSLIRQLIASDKSIDHTLFPEDKDVDINSLLMLNKENEMDKKHRFITFVDLRRIFDSLSISIDAELVEYLIYFMKSSFKDDKASLYDLNYLALIELLSAKPDPEAENADEKSLNEEEEQSYEITPETYEKIISDILGSVVAFAKKKKINPLEIFKADVALVEEETTKERFHIIELKDFIEKLDTIVGLDLKELEIYCLYTKLKFDEVENDMEAISYTKLTEELELKSSAKPAKINKSENFNNKKLKLTDFSKEAKLNNKVSLSQSGVFKQVEKTGELSGQENTQITKPKSIKEEAVVLTKFVSLLQSYLNSNSISLSEFQQILIKEVGVTNSAITITQLNTYLKSKGILCGGYLNLSDLTEFARVNESNEDIVLNITSLFSYLSNKMGGFEKAEKDDKNESFQVYVNSNEHNDDKEEKPKEEVFDKEEHTDSGFDQELNEALSNFDD